MAFPTANAALASFSTNFATRISASPEDFALTAAQAAAYQALHDEYITQYNAWLAALESGTRSRSLTAAKNDAKWALLDVGRELYAFVQRSLSVTNANKELLNVVIPDREPTPIPPPAMAPQVIVLSSVGRRVNIKIIDPNETERRARPAGVSGITILSYVGDDPPVNLADWVFQANTSRLTGTVQFPSSVPDGAKVWITAFYFNPRKESGPAANPVSANLPGGNVQLAS